MLCGEPVPALRSLQCSSLNLMLASGSDTRWRLLERAGLQFQRDVPRIDESAVVNALASEGESPRSIAIALAELKAKRIAHRHPSALTLGCDQVLEFDGKVVQKSRSIEEALSTLKMLRGNSHQLHSAAVAHEGMMPVWRHVSSVRLVMRICPMDLLSPILRVRGVEYWIA